MNAHGAGRPKGKPFLAGSALSIDTAIPRTELPMPSLDIWTPNTFRQIDELERRSKPLTVEEYRKELGSLIAKIELEDKLSRLDTFGFDDKPTNGLRFQRHAKPQQKTLRQSMAEVGIADSVPGEEDFTPMKDFHGADNPGLRVFKTELRTRADEDFFRERANLLRAIGAVEDRADGFENVTFDERIARWLYIGEAYWVCKWSEGEIADALKTTPNAIKQIIKKIRAARIRLQANGVRSRRGGRRAGAGRPKESKKTLPPQQGEHCP